MANVTPRNIPQPDSEEDDPYVSASAACRASCKATVRAVKSARMLADLKEAQCQHVRYKDMEAHLLEMAQGVPDLNMGDCKEELTTRRAAKKSSGTKSQAAQSNTDSTTYLSPTRRSKTSNKLNQVSSPAAHYATGALPSTTSPKTALAQYFEPGGGADQDLLDTVRRAK